MCLRSCRPDTSLVIGECRYDAAGTGRRATLVIRSLEGNRSAALLTTGMMQRIACRSYMRVPMRTKCVADAKMHQSDRRYDREERASHPTVPKNSPCATPFTRHQCRGSGVSRRAPSSAAAAAVVGGGGGRQRRQRRRNGRREVGERARRAAQGDEAVIPWVTGLYRRLDGAWPATRHRLVASAAVVADARRLSATSFLKTRHGRSRRPSTSPPPTLSVSACRRPSRLPLRGHPATASGGTPAAPPVPAARAATTAARP